MRLALISDLHIDYGKRYEPQDHLQALVTTLRHKKADLLVIAGDISDSAQLSMAFVEEVQALAQLPVYWIPGNHDLWDKSQPQDQIDTWQIYDQVQAHPQTLIGKPLRLNEDWGLVAHPAWYNYAVYDKEQFSPAEIARGKYRMATWQDKKYINWGQSDPELSHLFAQQIEADLQTMKDKKIILVTHMVTIPEYTMRMPHKVFDYFNAFLATDDLAVLIDSYPVYYNLMGHFHIRYQLKKGHCQYLAAALGYSREWRNKDIEGQYNQTLYVINL